MKQVVNSVYKPLFTSNKRYVILMGGRGAGRSTVASQFAVSKLLAPEYSRCAIMRLVLGDIRNSIYKEITDRIEEAEIEGMVDTNDTMMSIKYGQNMLNAQGFKKSSGEQKAKLKSLANYNCVIIEEADEIAEEDFIQLDDSLRTIKEDIKIILLLNPPAANHWIIKRWFNLLPVEVEGFYKPELKEEHFNSTTFIYTSYKDNIQNIDKATCERYEDYLRLNPSHYYNMIRGYIPEVLMGKIYSGWKRVPKVPHGARLIGYGLDFGFDPDPIALVACYFYNGEYLFEEKLYQTRINTEQLATYIKTLPYAPVVGDSASPALIEELRLKGVRIIPVEKKGDGKLNSKAYGINLVKNLKISYTGDSKNLENEYNNYAWKMNKSTGESMGVPETNAKDHLCDALRYVAMTLIVNHDPYEEVRKEIELEKSRMQYIDTKKGEYGV